MHPSLPLFDCKLTLFRHTKPIHVLKISPDGQKLLSGADDGMLIIWNLEDGGDQQMISVAFNGPITSAVWMPLSREASNAVFAFGTADGNLFLYTHHETYYEFAFSITAHEGAIEDIAFALYHKRLATVGNGCLKLWDIDKKRFSVDDEMELSASNSHLSMGGLLLLAAMMVMQEYMILKWG
ncbi:hypothetical protein K443DRAFT_133925 [Laccaria amethystina LaAM-08-1]|uniref:Unplaced genomic scaffold K443scaffold_166, whole genome shotgun sequence n=1 Tax=Laccaria amethystina LaAM-08-1 TaxID=1095629 RepID=A0A0C9X721_9AGAR|nr:hypothetical protein K443DRAFT_133925 [Laccaria amethystina LaAM-08-1]